MAEGFLQRYNDELSAVRRRASRFADAFPKIAGRLRMTGEIADDPHVERLIQSFAYSAARVRQKLDDEFPELTDGLLETLYPHYLAPLPSMSIVQFTPSDTLASVQPVPRHTEIFAEPIGGEACRFRTTQDTDVLPVEIVSAELSGQPISAPPSAHAGAAGCLRLSIRSRDASKPLGELGLQTLRLYIASPWPQAVAIHELLANHTLGLALANHADDREPLPLPASNLRPIGFEAEQAMLPYPSSSFAGYRLLTEFFALPQKFLFIDIVGLQVWRGETMEIFVYLKDTDAKLERAVSARDFAINVTPVVNLFRQTCEPLALDGTRTEYRLLPDARRQKTREIYAIEHILLSGRGGEEEACMPFFGRSQKGAKASVFWQSARRFDDDDGTSDTDIAFVDGAIRGTAEVGDYFLLHILNRADPMLRHIAANATRLHPMSFYEQCIQLAGELATFTMDSKRASDFPPYNHDDLKATFAAVFDDLRTSLSAVLEQAAVAIELAERRHGVRVGTINDRSLLKDAGFVLAVRAEMPAEDVRRKLPAQIKVGPVEKIAELVNVALPGVPVRPLPVLPRQLPYRSGTIYFELDTKNPLWKQLETSGAIALHLSGDFPGLEMELWALRE